MHAVLTVSCGPAAAAAAAAAAASTRRHHCRLPLAATAALSRPHSCPPSGCEIGSSSGSQIQSIAGRITGSISQSGIRSRLQFSTIIRGAAAASGASPASGGPGAGRNQDDSAAQHAAHLSNDQEAPREQPPAPEPPGLTGSGTANSVSEEQHPAAGMGVADNQAATPNSTVLGANTARGGGGDNDEAVTFGGEEQSGVDDVAGEPWPAAGEGEPELEAAHQDAASIRREEAQAGCSKPPLLEDDMISDDWGPPTQGY